MALLFRLGLICLLWLVSARLEAQTEPPGYRETVDEALSELSAQHYEEAQALFARAHELYPNARTLRGLGFTEFERRHYVACIQFLERALTAREKPLEGVLREETERLIGRAKNFVGYVTVDTKPAATQVRVDGLDTDERTLLLDAGRHQVELFGPGFSPERRTIDVHSGERKVLTVVFARPESTGGHDDAPRKKSWARSPWLWSAVTLAVAGAVVGTYFGLHGRSPPTAEPYGGSTAIQLGGP